jgi:rhodanese-related sulfurtransferase
MKRLRSLFILFILLALTCGACQTKDYSEKLESLYKHTVPVITVKELADEKRLEKPMVLLDIRSPEEYTVSRIEGARFVDYDHFSDKDVADISKESEIILYCSVGYRSEKIGEKLLDIGYKNVRNLYGGIFQWKNEGFEVVNKHYMRTDSVHTYNKSWSVWLINGVKVY